MAVSDNQKSKTTAILIIIGIAILLGVVILIVWGWIGITKFFMLFLTGLLFLSLLFALAFLFWYLFIKKHKFDVNYVNKKKLLDACTRIKRPGLKDLYVSGDKGHTRGKVGKIRGWCRIQILTRRYLYTETTDQETGMTTKTPIVKKNERGEDVPQYELEGLEQDVFAVTTPGLLGLFIDPMVIRVDPRDHTDLIGDVTLYGFSLIPLSEYWFLNSDHLDVRKIDFSILKEAERTIAFVTMTDMREIVDRATGLDGHHKKELERKSYMELPETKGQQQPTPY